MATTKIKDSRGRRVAKILGASALALSLLSPIGLSQSATAHHLNPDMCYYDHVRNEHVRKYYSSPQPHTVVLHFYRSTRFPNVTHWYPYRGERLEVYAGGQCADWARRNNQY
jgi:hypothetical protein